MPHGVEIGPAHFGQFDPARMAYEEVHTDVFLEQADMVAHAGLGHAEFAGRLGETRAARGRLEGAQPVQRRQFVGHGWVPRAAGGFAVA